MLRSAVKDLFLQEIDSQSKRLCVRSRTTSVLLMSRKDNKELKNFSWLKILSVMKENAPDVLDFISTIAAPTVKQDGQQIPPICMTYALMMHTRWRELSLCQKIVSVILGVGHVTKKVYHVIFLNRAYLHIYPLTPTPWPKTSNTFLFLSVIFLEDGWVNRATCTPYTIRQFYSRPN